VCAHDVWVNIQIKYVRHDGCWWKFGIERKSVEIAEEIDGKPVRVRLGAFKNNNRP
jgi:hypothetical protein